MSYYLASTDKTPELIVEDENGKIGITGVSVPENPNEFYSPLLEDIEAYIQNPKPNTVFEIQLEYFNTSTALVLRNILRKLEPLSKNSNLEIKWMYESSDEDMMEAGSEFKFLFKELNFELLGIN